MSIIPTKKKRPCNKSGRPSFRQRLEYEERQPWEDLCNGIIQQAVDDYKDALKTLDQCIKQGYSFEITNSAAYDIRMLNRWFRSEWYGALTRIDSEYLIQNLNKHFGNNAITEFVNKYTIYEKERI